MSKRSQVRNEKALQELVKAVPGNDRCADCGARNPGWASWSLGIFLCMRCASLHRKLGTHISKVKSLSMDSWTNEQVDSMRRNGNVVSNKIYNPRNSQPAIPLDVDEVDAALERFIRQKYDRQSYAGGGAVRPTARQDTGGTQSSDDQPPPLPPKPGKRFGFRGLRSVSSALPTGKSAYPNAPISPERTNGYPPSPPPRVNKQSRVFGASVGGGGENNESKLATLRDMGFADDKRNSTILKGLNGDLERAIETLVRLGDGNTPTSRPRSPSRPKPVALSQPFSSVGVEPPQTASGISIAPASAQEPKIEAPLPPIPLNTTGHETNPSMPQSHNPFDTLNARSDTWPLEKAFQSMQVSQPQPLFPNATGGYPMQPNHIEANRIQQSMTPPVPQLHQHVHSNPYAQQMSTASNSFNPFLQPSQQNLSLPSNTYNATNLPQVNSNMYNPFESRNFTPMSYTYGGTFQSPQDFVSSPIPEQQYPPMTDQSQSQSIPQQQEIDPYQQYPPFNVQPPTQYQQPSYQNQYQPQPSGRFDNSSILALYNYPQLAPPLPSNAGVASENQAPLAALPTTSSGTVAKMPGQRSVTMPAQLVSGSRNPFLTSQSNTVAVTSNAISALPSGLSRNTPLPA
ncbi:MAG: hypothetical protein Q9170_002797 [Blastenia crenularia]